MLQHLSRVKDPKPCRERGSVQQANQADEQLRAEMTNKKPRTTGHKAFPMVDRSVVSVGSALGESDEKAFWLSKTPLDRLEAVELLRQIAYGYDPTTTRLQRLLEATEFPPR